VQEPPSPLGPGLPLVARIVAVGKGDADVADANPAVGMIDVKPEVAGVLAEEIGIVVGVAEDDVSGQAGQDVQDGIASHVAQVNEDARPGGAEALDGGPQGINPAVRVGDETESGVRGIGGGETPDGVRGGMGRGVSVGHLGSAANFESSRCVSRARPWIPAADRRRAAQSRATRGHEP